MMTERRRSGAWGVGTAPRDLAATEGDRPMSDETITELARMLAEERRARRLAEQLAHMPRESEAGDIEFAREQVADLRAELDDARREIAQLRAALDAAHEHDSADLAEAMRELAEVHAALAAVRGES
jgi:chromosome segregation ATPase